MPAYTPVSFVTMMPIPDVDSYLVAPPMVFTSLADRINTEPQSYFTGRYIPTDGRIDGYADTLLRGNVLDESGSSSPATKWVVEKGENWTDEWRPGNGTVRGLLFHDGSIGQEIAAYIEAPEKEDYRLLIHRGFPPTPREGYNINEGVFVPAEEDTSRPDRTYLHIEIAEGYRLSLQNGRPLTLEKLYSPLPSSGVVAPALWRPVASAKQLGNSQEYLARNGFQIPLRVSFLEKGGIEVEVGDGNYLRAVSSTPVRPKVRIEGRNGWVGVLYQPVRYPRLVVGGSSSLPASPERVERGLAGSFAVADGQYDRIELNTAIDAETGRLRWEATLENEEDTPDGIGSQKRISLNSVSVVLPAEWTDTPFGFIDLTGPGLVQFHPTLVSEVQRLDPIRRVLTSEARVVVNNPRFFFTGTFGRMAANLTASNGGPYFQRIRGIAGIGGYQFHRNDPQNTVEFTIRDRSVVMQKPIGQEVIFDGWSLWSVVRFLATCGNIHPRYQVYLPLYVPPGATVNDPYGPAGEDMPEWSYALPRGTGLNPRFRYMPDATCWDILQSLVVDMVELGSALPSPIGIGSGGYVYPRRAVPYYMGFDPMGYFHFEPIDFAARPVKYTFSTSDYIESIQVLQSADEMRSEIIFQGIDAQTNELLHAYRPMDDLTRYLVGYRDEWIERSARYASENYLRWAMEAAAFQLALPQQVFTITLPFIPDLYAGDVIAVFDEKALGGMVTGVVEQLQSLYGYTAGSGHAVGTMSVTCRNVVNTI